LATPHKAWIIVAKIFFLAMVSLERR